MYVMYVCPPQQQINNEGEKKGMHPFIKMVNGSVLSLKSGERWRERGGRSILINVKEVFLYSLCNSLICTYIIHTLYASMISYNSP